VGVDVDQIELAQRLHPQAQRVADRVVAADRHHQRSALGDRPRGARDAAVVRLRVRALDQDVAHIRHGHARQVVAVRLHVVPALGARILPGARKARIVELSLGRLAGSSRPRPLAGRDPGLGRAAVVGDAEERDLGIERVEVAHARHPEERPRRGVGERRGGLHGRKCRGRTVGASVLAGAAATRRRLLAREPGSGGRRGKQHRAVLLLDHRVRDLDRTAGRAVEVGDHHQQ
jgi:hypothetical protein